MGDDAFVIDLNRRTAAIQAVALGLISVVGIGIALTGHLAALFLLVFAAPATGWFGPTAIKGVAARITRMEARGLAVDMTDCASQASERGHAAC